MARKMNSNHDIPTDNAVGYNYSFGTFSSSTVSTDPMNKISSSKTKSVDICTDDGGANFGTTDVRAVRSRVLLTTAQSGAASIAGFLGQLKNTAADTTTGNKCGVKGYYEASATATIATGSAGVMGMLDAPSGATIAAGYAAGVKASSVDLGGTHTGKAVGFAVDTPVAGTWDAALWLTTAGGSAQSGSGAANGTIIGKVKVYIDGVLGYINVYPTNN